MTVLEAGAGSRQRHEVHLYRGDEDLIGQIAPLLVSALGEGAVLVVVATRPHRDGFEASLRDAGLSTPSLIAAGDLRFLDARETVREVLVAEAPDTAMFDGLVGAAVRDAAATRRPVLVFGEMVDLLWNSGLVTAAIDLEAMWNDLGRHVAFSLICAYENAPEHGADGADEFTTICALHTAVVRGSGNETRASCEASREFLATSSAPAAARSFAAAQLAQWGEPGLVDDAALIVSELATNAISHGRSDFVVGLSCERDFVRIAVVDIGGGALVPRAAHATARSGRGLAIVGAVASRWGWEQQRPGKRVWAELARA